MNTTFQTQTLLPANDKCHQASSNVNHVGTQTSRMGSIKQKLNECIEKDFRMSYIITRVCMAFLAGNMVYQGLYIAYTMITTRFAVNTDMEASYLKAFTFTSLWWMFCSLFGGVCGLYAAVLDSTCAAKATALAWLLVLIGQAVEVIDSLVFSNVIPSHPSTGFVLASLALIVLEAFFFVLIYVFIQVRLSKHMYDMDLSLEDGTYDAATSAPLMESDKKDYAGKTSMI